MSVTASSVVYAALPGGKKRHVFCGGNGMSLCSKARRKDARDSGTSLPVCPECKEALARKVAQ